MESGAALDMRATFNLRRPSMARPHRPIEARRRCVLSRHAFDPLSATSENEIAQVPNSIAVLPLANISGDPEYACSRDGVSEEIASLSPWKSGAAEDPARPACAKIAAGAIRIPRGEL